MTNTALTIVSASFALALGALSAQAQTAQAPKQASAPVGTSGGSMTAPVSRSAVTADYRLVAGDKLRIEVYKDAQLSQTLQVRPDGKITLPLVGDINAAGRTSSELRESITTSLKEYNTNPVVTVIVTETVPAMVYVMGEVQKPGSQALIGQMTILQVLANAGGFTDFAKKSDIQILRNGPSGVQTTLRFNYKDAEKGRVKPLIVQNGDTILVK